MANKNLTELVFILDRSGSMCGLETDTIGGYNGMIQKQRKEAGDAVVTTVLFDDQYEMLRDRVAIGKIKDITEKEYYARGMTALLDAIGKTISHVAGRHKNALESEVPQKTMMVIITDGCENASREYSLWQVKQMIEEQKQQFGWEFLFLGANIDAVSTAASFGITADRAVTYEADGAGTQMNFEAVSHVAKCMRSSMPVEGNWKAKIEKYREKKRKS